MIKKTMEHKIKALLLDLDGTLLELDLDLFVPALIRLLASHFSSICGPEQFAVHLMGSVGAMIENDDPALTNEAVFFKDFCRRLNQPFDSIYPIFEQFYKKEFPRLRPWSRQRPGARPLIETARRHDLKLVLATNPLFPLAAVAHRLEWAGLSTEQFDLITTVENSHFCKPRPEYYLEIAGAIGCRPQECLMAGNDVQEDLSAARVGMATFLVEGMILHRESGEPQCTYRGSLEDLAELINKQEDR